MTELATPRLPRLLTRHVFVHPDVGRDVASGRWERLAGRATLVLKALAARGTWHFKGVSGVNRGWRRTGLGGSGGFHFYLWWTVQGSGPGKTLPLEPGAVVVRAIRHHDATDDATPLPVGRLEDYARLAEARFELGPAADPWTPAQRSFLQDTARVRVLKGLPGSGKTTCLWETVERLGGRRVLYLTWSRALAEEARRYFEVHASRDTEIEVRSFSEFLGLLLGEDVEPIPFREAVAQLKRLLQQGRIRNHILRQQLERDRELYFGLMRGWIKGRHLWRGRRVPPPAGYEDAGTGDPESDPVRAWDQELQDALGRARQLYTELKLTEDEEDQLFPELSAAVRLKRRLLADAAKVLPRRWDLVVLDEVQDLTPAELDVVLHVCRHAPGPDGRPPELVLAGDEGQSVRHTYFEWRELNNQLATVLEAPSDVQLDENQRNPAAIGEALARAQVLYRHLKKALRPGGQRSERVDVEGDATVCVTRLASDAEAAAFLRELAEQTDAAFIHLGEDPPDWAIADEVVRDRLRTPSEAKGLEFAAVCILGASEAIGGLTEELALHDPLKYRLSVNRLRVAISRATQTLAFIEVGDEPPPELLAIAGDAKLAPEILVDRLVDSDLPPDERFARLIAAARHDMEERPGPAWRTLRRVQALATQEGYRGVWDDLELKVEVDTLLARIAFAQALRTGPGVVDAPSLAEDGRAALTALGGESLVALWEAVEGWQHARSPGKAGQEEFGARVVRALEPVVAVGRSGWLADELGRARVRFGALLELLAASGATAGLFAGHVEGWLVLFGHDRFEAATTSRRLRRGALDTLLAAARHDAAIEVCVALEPIVDAEDLARKVALLRATARHDELARLLEAHEDGPGAFEAWLDAGDVDAAMRVGTWLEPAARAALASMGDVLGLLRAGRFGPRERQLLAGACLPMGPALERAHNEARRMARDLEAGHKRLQQQLLELQRSRQSLATEREQLSREVEAAAASRTADLERREFDLAEREQLAEELERLQQQDLAAAHATIIERREAIEADRLRLEHERKDLRESEAFVMQQFNELEAAEKALEPKTSEMQRMMADMQREAEQVSRASADLSSREEALRKRERNVAKELAELIRQQETLQRMTQKSEQARLDAEQAERKLKQRQDAVDTKDRRVRERETLLEARDRDLKQRLAALELRERDLKAAREAAAKGD